MDYKVVSTKTRRGPKGHPIEFKLRLVELLNQRGTTAVSLSKEYGVTTATLYQWRRDLNLGGADSFRERLHFDSETKHLAVEEYLSGNYTAYEVCQRHNIPREQTLREWVRRVKRNLPLARRYPKRNEHVKTTKEERLKLVRNYIDSGYSFSRMENPNRVSNTFVKFLVELYEDYGEKGLDDDIFVNKNYPVNELVVWKNGQMRNWCYQKIYGWWKRHSPMCEKWKRINSFVQDFTKIEGYSDAWFLKKKKLVLKEGRSVWSLENCKIVDVVVKEPKRNGWIFVHEDGTQISAKTLKGFAKAMGLSYVNLNNQATVHRGLHCDGWRGFRVGVFERIKHLLPTHYYIEAEKLFTLLCRKGRFSGSDFADFIERLPMIENYNEGNLLTGKTRVVLKEGETVWSLENCRLSPPVYRKTEARGGDKMITVFFGE